MTTVEISSTSLPTQFSSLPPELRSQIWRDVLPETFQPTMIPYKTGCWEPQYIPESDVGYEPDDSDKLHLVYQHEHLARPKVDLPLFFVNREARGIVRSWMSQRGIEIRFHQGASCPTFVRRFDPSQDILYVLESDWDEFCSEPVDRPFESDMLNKHYSVGGRQLSSIAVSEQLFMKNGSDFTETLLGYFYPAILFVVVDTHADTCPRDHDKKQHWALEADQVQALAWDINTERFNWDEGEQIFEQILYDHIEEVANQWISEGLIEDLICGFEIRPVMAVKT